MFWLYILGCSGVEKEANTPDELVEPAGEPSQEEEELAVPLMYRYLMAFHSCDTSQGECGNPQRHQVHIAGADAIDDWELLLEVPPFDGSVPDLLVRNDILYIYSLPELRRLDLKTGLWMEVVILELSDTEGEPLIYVDPSVTLDSQGRISLFFMEGIEGSDPATCAHDEESCTKYFYSATEDEGSLGAAFTLDEGVRMSIDLVAGEIAADSDIFEGPDGFYQYVSRGQNVQVFFSEDMKGDYTPLSLFPNGVLTSQASGGVPSGHYDSENDLFWTFVSTQNGPLSEIRLAIHSQQEQLTSSDFQTILTGPDYFSDYHLVSSPGFWPNEP